MIEICWIPNCVAEEVLVNTLVDQIDGTLEWSKRGGTAATITLGKLS